MNIYYLIAAILELTLGILLTISYCRSKLRTIWDIFTLGQSYIFTVLFAIIAFIQ